MVLGVVPERLKVALQELYKWGGGSLCTSRLNDVDVDAQSDIRP